MTKEQFLSLIGSAESGSEHPLGRTIYQYVLSLVDERKQNGDDLGDLTIFQPTNFHAEPGQVCYTLTHEKAKKLTQPQQLQQGCDM